MTTILTYSDKGEQTAKQIVSLGFDAKILRSPKLDQTLWNESSLFVFIGAMGICVREIAPFLKDKKTDPAVINMDVNGKFVQPVLSGHQGGANEKAEHIARLLGAIPVLTTVSDTSNLWGLDMLPKQFDWKLEAGSNLTKLMASFVNGKKTALLLECRDRGTLFLETSKPDHVEVFYNTDDLKVDDFEVILAVTPYLHNLGNKAIYYRPAMINMGMGAQKDIDALEFESVVKTSLKENGLSFLSLAEIGTVDIKKDEEAFVAFSENTDLTLQVFGNEELSAYQVPNPSEKVEEVTGSASVSEAVAMHLSKNELFVPKQKLQIKDKFATIACAIDKRKERKGFIEFVGAGPGDPELVSVRGKRLLQTADFILYAGSLVPKELTHYAKPGCVVKSSAGMDLDTQIAEMRPFYDRGLFVVRLHTGDPCIYGAIQEQMAVLDKDNMDYHITPGISSFQAAAAALESQFTIPEEVQSIILTRGEGRTPMPPREKLSEFAKFQSTMCIYLSASIADKVQAELLEGYPEETPVAVCYKLTWKEEKVVRCQLKDLAKTVKDNNLTMTTMIVVGKAIDNRSNLSKLYHKEFKHAFRG
ncbi:precorrin-4 C(11)-methyltransferase [Labilibacter marinus]|uniref:precorrin-4 C(11)-methyltransferase n=1 Tax=Labilibacter marinus TaxID=1477105 RepID=UPI0009502BCE|nr:precorrin-4 C(11)-methyltransferase [Labilibacter marinus]